MTAEGLSDETIDELEELDSAIREAQAKRIGAKTKEQERKEDQENAASKCCYDCCCFSLV